MKSKYIEAFDVSDPYNDNTIKGYINREGGLSYGALKITHVNNLPCEQIIWCVPKMTYPFNTDGVFRRITGITKVEVFEKLDGTSICCYKYRDAYGKPYITYKTRLRPILGSSKFGDFKALWDEMLIKYPNIQKLVDVNKCNVAFELYGRRNKINIRYKEKLECAVLFGIYPQKIVPPTVLDTLDVPVARHLKTILPSNDFEERYKNCEDWLNKHISKNEEGNIDGIEGAVWYVTHNGVIQYKVKPDIIKDIHWASKRIPIHSIYITIMNAYEETDTPTYDLIFKLLQEEFEDSDVSKREETIKKLMVEIDFKKRVEVELKEHYIGEGFDINKDKSTCMRYFGKKYPKNQASKIYNYLMDEYGVE